MILYAESSAVLAWLLGEARRDEVWSLVGRAELIVASEWTFVECQRAITRMQAVGALSATAAEGRRAALATNAERWNRLPLEGTVLDRAGAPFPIEPIRALDAIHLASALEARNGLPGLAVLSLDSRIRDSARALGFEVVPG